MVFSNFRSKHKWSFPVTPKQERSQKTSECRGIDDPGWIAENQSPQTVREDRTKNRYDPFVCFERAYESQFVHDEHNEKVHGKGAGLCPRPCLTGQRPLDIHGGPQRVVMRVPGMASKRR